MSSCTNDWKLMDRVQFLPEYLELQKGNSDRCIHSASFSRTKTILKFELFDEHLQTYPCLDKYVLPDEFPASTMRHNYFRTFIRQAMKNNLQVKHLAPEAARLCQLSNFNATAQSLKSNPASQKPTSSNKPTHEFLPTDMPSGSTFTGQKQLKSRLAMSWLEFGLAKAITGIITRWFYHREDKFCPQRLSSQPSTR